MRGVVGAGASGGGERGLDRGCAADTRGHGRVKEAEGGATSGLVSTAHQLGAGLLWLGLGVALIVVWKSGKRI